MKKWTTLLVVLCLVLSFAAVGSAETADKPWKGKVISVWGVEFDYMFDTDGNLRNPLDTNTPMHAALVEWAADNECTIKRMGGDTAALQAAIASGEGPDLMNVNTAFPSYPMQGLAEALPAEFVAKVSEKYGSRYSDIMTIDGKCYGLNHAWSSLGAIQYNRTMMEDLGIKTPREYFEEGNWTYETFKQCLKDCTVDVDGDGQLDSLGIFHFDLCMRIMPVYKLDAEGKAVSLLDTQRSRDFWQLMYEGYTVDKSITRVYAGLNRLHETLGGSYVMMRFWQVEPFLANTLIYVDSEGYTIETVPVPCWKQGDTEQSSSTNLVYLMLAKGAKNPDAALDLMDRIFECEMETMDITSGGAYGFDFEGVKGSTEWTKEYIQVRDARIAEINAELAEIPEYDPEWIQTIVDYYKNTNYHMVLSLPDVGEIVSYEMRDKLIDTPSASAIAELQPVLEASCNTYNNTYITK